MTSFVRKRPSMPALALAAVLLLAVAALFVAALRINEALAERAAANTTVAASIAQTRAIVGRLDQLPTLDGALYEAATPQLAQAALQNDAQTLAENHGLTVDIIRPEEIDASGSFVAMGLTVSGALSEPALWPFLTEIAAHRPLMLVEEIDIRRGRGDDRLRLLSITVRLSAFAEAG